MFRKTRIALGGKTLLVEVADTNEKRERGLMNRTSLKENSGMIFIFSAESKLSFWMKNTSIPLDIGYFDQNKKLVDIQSMQPSSPMEIQPRSYPSKRLAKYALEMPARWFEKNHVKIGDRYKAVTQ